MKILLVNKFYYPRGGDCMVVLNTEKLLREAGHEVAVYAMHYEQNIDCDTARYFAGEVKFAGGIGNKFKALKRTLGMGDIKSSFTGILNSFNPDVVHLHNIHSYLSPVLAKLAKKHGSRVVWTMHDYKLVCPAYTCLSNGKVCEKCITGGKWNVVSGRCMKGSAVASAVAWLEALKWNRKQLERYTDAFICPSQFMASMMEKAGFEHSKLKILTNFTTAHHTSNNRDSYYCYAGRLSTEKGIEGLLEAASHLPHHLKVAGTGPLEEKLRSQYGKCKNIEFLGQLQPEDVAHLLTHAHASVLPSQWYENNPLGVIESLVAGTPVVGTHMGGIPELITPDNGIIAEIENLSEAIDQAMSRTWDNEAIAHDAQQRYSPEVHLERLINIYEQTDTK